MLDLWQLHLRRCFHDRAADEANQHLGHHRVVQDVLLRRVDVTGLQPRQTIDLQQPAAPGRVGDDVDAAELEGVARRGG